ncbi:MAG: class I SAM-dependent methyltransferase [Parvularculaceae bacterium]|nr:class I SAM-dependent methyltransferase [Parvularculaceae bacterium]
MLDHMTLAASSRLPEPLRLERAPLFFRIACAIASKLRYGALSFHLPDGRTLNFSGKEETDAHGSIIVRDFRFAKRSVLGGDIGFFESYADGQWDSPDIAEVLYVFARNADYVKEAFSKARLVKWAANIRHALNKNTKSGARRNIMAHYDLGNRFYEQWLDPTMTYSSAVFPENCGDLCEAQINKYRRLAQAAGIRPGDRVLEIGSGWGGFAEVAAKEYGATVTGLTISPSQLDYARKRLFDQGLADRAEFRLQDYRDVEGRFDKVVSIEMFEAVGRQYWPAYFAKVRDVLKPGGAAALQIITIQDRFFDAYSRSTDFIQRYVFPGGMLPCLSALRAEMTRAGLVWRDAANFGRDYARTLNAWSSRFLSAWDRIEPLGFDERFKKLWRFYLAYCEAGFRAQTTDVYQIAATRA